MGLRNDVCRVVRVGVLAIGLPLVLIACNAVTGTPQVPGRASAELLDPNEVIALVPAANDGRMLVAEATARGFTLREDVVLPGLNRRMLRFAFPAPFDGAGAIALLEGIDASAVAGVNHIYTTATVPGASGFDYADALIAWPSNSCRLRGPVGMIDTHVADDMTRQTGGRLVARTFVRGGDGVTRHGTDVASVMMDPERVSGVTLYNAAVIGRGDDGRERTGVDSILKALDWLAEAQVRVVNVSLAGPFNKLLDEGVDEAVSRGMLLVAAVGNDGAGAGPRYPAAFDDVIAVTAIDADREIYRNAVHGAHVDIAAPGVDIRVVSGDQTRFVTGTSMAVPFVTMGIAMDRNLYGQDASAVRRILARRAQDLGASGPDPVFGAGLLQMPSACAG